MKRMNAKEEDMDLIILIRWVERYRAEATCCAVSV
jgi:hypothetical protein